jgi:hypothetical protein
MFHRQAMVRCSNADLHVHMLRKGGGDCRIWQKCHVFLDRGYRSIVQNSNEGLVFCHQN